MKYITREVPFPNPLGEARVQLRLLGTKVDFWTEKAGRPKFLSSNNATIITKLLTTANLIKVVTALLLERQVLLVSSSLAILTPAAEALRQLIFPFEIVTAYIPMLPEFLTDVVGAPIGFVIGVHESIYTKLIELGDILNDDVVIVNLDKNTVDTKVIIPSLPAHRLSKLTSCINDNVSNEFLPTPEQKLTKILKKKQLLHETNSPPPTSLSPNEIDTPRSHFINSYAEAFMGRQRLTTNNSNDDENSIDPIDDPCDCTSQHFDNVQAGFLNLFTALMKNYRSYLQFPSTESNSNDLRTTTASAGTSTNLNAGFNVDDFVASYPREYVDFLTAFCKTQMFDNFITMRLFDPSNEKGLFFDECVERKLRRSSTLGKLTSGSSSQTSSLFESASVIKRGLKTTVAADPTEPSPSAPEHLTYSYPRFPKTINSGLIGPEVEIARTKFKNVSSITKHTPVHKSNWSSIYSGGAHFASSHQLSVTSPESATFTVFFIAFTAVVGRRLEEREDEEMQRKQRQKEEERLQRKKNGGGGVSGVSGASGPSTDGNDDFINLSPVRNKQQEKLAEARVTAKAELDLAFEVLSYMKKRSITTEVMAYQCLIEACGRCGDTERVMELLKCMSDDGIAADNNIYSCLVRAFSIKETPSTSSTFANGYNKRIDWNKIRTNMASGGSSTIHKPSPFTPKRPHKRSGSTFSFDTSATITGQSSQADSKANETAVTTNNGSSSGGLNKKLFGGLSLSSRSFLISKKSEDLLSEAHKRQITLGDNLLELLFPNVVVDANRETCPSCGKKLTEHDVLEGFTLGDSNDYTTACSGCEKRFVARFSVHSTKEGWNGTQGPNELLFCEFLSPWTIRKELLTILGDEGGLKRLMHPDFALADSRHTMTNATLWWNLVCNFRREDLPIAWLFESSFGKCSFFAPLPSEC